MLQASWATRLCTCDYVKGKLNIHVCEISTSSAEYESRSLEKARNDDDNSFVLLVKIVNLKLLSTSQCSSCAYAS